jgi:serine/threonine protein kinase
MKSRIASVCAAGGLDRVNCAVQLLEDEWQQHGEVQLSHFWNQPRCREAIESVDEIDALAELIKADLQCRFARGQTPAVAEYLERFPELRIADSRVLSLVYEEYCLNEERGTAPDIESFCERYPDWKSSLVSQLQCHRNISRAAGVRPALPRFPEVGQVFDVFRLQSMLGSGGMSRVFLANDLSLGGKRVVLKVALDRGQEPKVQGSLDHPHIVPVNSVVYPDDGELCGLSMPYWPGLSLDKLIGFINPASRPRKALVIWRELELGTRYSANPPVQGELSTDARTGQLPTAPRGDGWEGFPIRGGFPQGAAWVVMIISRALHYAHGRNTFHRDVKPGNVLLTLHNGPQLLDFNLAESPHSADHAQAALHGGTLPYMAPEQIEAFINSDLWDKVGAKADIYSLGLVLREMLTGEKPDIPDAAAPPARALRAVLDRRRFLDASVRRFNPAIPHALEAIVAKCLTPSPHDRYADAQALEQDLDLFLKHQPLAHAVNPSRPERLGNWMRRRRRSLAAVACLLLVCSAYPVFEWLRPRPIHSTAAFLSAVRLFDMRNSAPESAAQFNSFKAVDPHSALVKFYVSFALEASQKPSDHKQYDEPDLYMREALAAPDAEITAMTWFKDHLKFGAYLVDFAKSRVGRADHTAQKYENNESDEEDRARDKEVRSAGYQLAMDALRLTQKLNPGDLQAQLLLAKTEQHFGLYASAYERLSRVIDRFNPETQNDLLFNSHELRVWVARRWAERDLDAHKADEETQARLLEAGKDHAYCARYLVSHNFGESQAFKTYYVDQHGLRAWVALAEVELELSMREDVKKHIAEGEQSLHDLNAHIESNKLKVAKTTRLARRLEDCRKRLRCE